MEREATLLVLSLSLCGAACLAAGWVASPLLRAPVDGRSPRTVERAAWRRIWWPLLPAAIALAVLVGWALQAPDDTDDGIHVGLMVAAIPGAILAARALARAIISARFRGRVLVATVGLLRPRIVVDPAVAFALDPTLLAAARAHEAAHARHRDPLRIWLAQLATDLQWPAPGARRRLHAWLHALEIARDREACEAGTDGADLAEAMIEVSRIARSLGTSVALAGAHLVNPPGERLRDRVDRLLASKPAEPTRSTGAVRVALIVAIALVGAALAFGMAGGDALLRCLPGVHAA